LDLAWRVALLSRFSESGKQVVANTNSLSHRGLQVVEPTVPFMKGMSDGGTDNVQYLFVDLTTMINEKLLKKHHLTRLDNT
jgi:hypothetical protein